ncbi:MarR family transcriptional regulator [Methylobacterium sp. WL30]|uniref:MarR family winged helix-turn-helix transcriptional regulator n=1 Tax=unclassified Methylobacterium TaxID=2615210 RepID=UPI0011CAA2D4|nr:MULTISPECIES: MarR family transcriptional regulator [unclassified Methylobacterium]TXN41681.1 MarR family transcriptional regulator [Methylobacterium sp. WL93]TXN49107.1 MarR family transcriptional regulator [Methylobacterium sp. WL119]TXN67788.1 MarR family transcriptional regulator [Methylobacterium sp. WL30]TXN75998.1 MarR family transcriptional regulator [Methylobacterium sp. WL18]
MSTSTKQTRLRLDDQLCFALYAATNSVVRAYRPLLGELGLTYPQYLVMLALWQDGVTAVHDLAARLQLTSSAITPLVDRLEAAGFVTRTRAVDRRIVLVALTEAGRLLEDQVATAQQAVVCRTGLGDRELADLRQELKDLADRVAAAGMAQGDEPG